MPSSHAEQESLLFLFPRQEAERLEPQEENVGYSYIDYSEKRSLPISVPDYRTADKKGDKYVVFDIYMAGRHLTSRRYSEFVDLHNNLKKEFLGFNFPKLPGKWPFAWVVLNLNQIGPLTYFFPTG